MRRLSSINHGPIGSVRMNTTIRVPKRSNWYATPNNTTVVDYYRKQNFTPKTTSLVPYTKSSNEHIDANTRDKIANIAKNQVETTLEIGRKQWEHIVTMIPDKCRVGSSCVVLIEKINDSLITDEVLIYIKQKMPEISVYENEECDCKPENMLGGLAALGLCLSGVMLCSGLLYGAAAVVGIATVVNMNNNNNKTYRIVYHNHKSK